MKPLALKKEEIEKPQSPPQMVDMNTAKQMVNDATETSFQRFKEYQEQQNKQYDQQPEVEGEQPELSDADMNIFESGTSKSIKNFVSAYRGLNDIFAPPPNPAQQAIEQAMSGLLSEFVTKRLGGGGTPTGPIGKSSFIIDLLNTQAAASFGHAFGENLPTVVQTLTSSLGPKKMQELADNVNKKIGNEPAALPEGNPEAENQKNMVLGLSSENPEHVKQYSQAMGLSEKAAKEMMVVHQNDIRNERQGTSGGNVGSVNNGNSEITNALSILIQEMTNMKSVINDLQNKVDGKNKSKQEDLNLEPEINEDSKWVDENEIPRDSSIDMTNRSVNLFSQPVKVDVDQIGGKNLKDSFFDSPKPSVDVHKEIPKETPKESVLEEIKDKDGNSTFKMSNTNEENGLEEELDDPEEDESNPEPEPEFEPKDVEDDKPEFTKEQPKEISKNQQNEVDIKKEKLKVEVDNETSTQNVDIKEETKRPVRRIVRKIIKLSEEPKQELYDIDNNLIN